MVTKDSLQPEDVGVKNKKNTEKPMQQQIHCTGLFVQSINKRA